VKRKQTNNSNILLGSLYYFANGHTKILNRVETITCTGVAFDSDLNYVLNINEKELKASSVLSLIGCK
jgi:hypothetical protein